MQLKEIRLSLIQIELLGDFLLTRQPPSIPFSFLLKGPLFQGQYEQASSDRVRVPWGWEGYATVFWRYYRPKAQGLKETWRALVPLEYAIEAHIEALWQGYCKVRAYLYPWGIGALLDISLAGAWEPDEAVDKALELRSSGKAKVQLNGQEKERLLNDILSAALDEVRNEAYGEKVTRGQRSAPFTISTPYEGEGLSASTAVASGDEYHKRLEGLTGWNSQWRYLNLKPLAGNNIDIKSQAPSAHILYGSRRGRTIWFPGYFRSASHDDRLRIYHENLTMATLQTESLCQLATHTSNLLMNNYPSGQWSISYDASARNSAGLLGRLYGGTLDTYRSKSLQHQIQTSYVDAVNTLRSHFNMPKLT